MNILLIQQYYFITQINIFQKKIHSGGLGNYIKLLEIISSYLLNLGVILSFKLPLDFNLTCLNY